ncbi:MAG TPA: heme-binding protein [Puia sp.]|uniref:GlcG/HbpS family heme-binding protein n=1 Tax=Puia sp. TaxID=2045100 RepID=UPI002BDA00A7|nr:heme-binding protein [Puia sp.]HVU94720.1 heme-binding protein [Puia sp.]
MNLSLEQAETAIKAAKEKARQLSCLQNIALVDAGVNLVAFARMDDAWIGSIDVALRKAKTARYFNMETGELGKWSQPGGPGWQIEHSNGGLITIPGGIPIKNKNGEIIGAIGASGSTAENDHAVAQAGADAINSAASL